MYKATSKVEEAYIRKYLEEDRALRAATMAKAGKVAKGREKAEDEGSSHGRGVVQATGKAAGDDHA